MADGAPANRAAAEEELAELERWFQDLQQRMAAREVHLARAGFLNGWLAAQPEGSPPAPVEKPVRKTAK